MWIGSLPLENCIPGKAPWLGSVDAIVLGSLSLSGLGRSFRDDALRFSPAIATGAELSGAGATGASAEVAVSAATGITGARDAGAAGTNREAPVVSGAGTATTAGAAAVAAVTGGRGAGATATAGTAGEAIPAGSPDSIVSGGRLLTTGACDAGADGIGSGLVVGSTRTSGTRGGSAAGEAITAGALDSIVSGGGVLTTGAGDAGADGIGSELVVGSTRTSGT